MTWAIKASLLAVAASVAAVGALRDQLAAGHCRWSHALSSVQQRAAKSGAAGGGVNSVAAASSPAVAGRRRMASWTWVDKWRRGGKGAADRAKRTEQSLTKVMYWDCWGPK